MSAAALGAVKLDQLLRERAKRGREGDWTGFAQHFQRELAQVNKPIWLLATGEDFRYPEAVGGQRDLFTKLTHQYIDRLIRRANRDNRVYKRVVEVMHLLKPPAALATPRILAASLPEWL